MKKIKNYFSDWTAFETIWLIASTMIMVSISIITKDGIISLISGITGIISVVLCAKGKIENYFFGLIAAITYGYICYTFQIYGEVMYNIAMVPMIIIGFISWKKNMTNDNKEVKARNLTTNGWIILITVTIFSIIIYNLILKYLGGSFTIIDASSTVLSTIATVLMLARYSEQWLMWILVNIVSVILWILSAMKGGDGSITLLIMWSAYLLNSIYGYINWRKMAANKA